MCGRRKIISRIATTVFRRADFDIFKDLLGGIPWAVELEDKGAKESLLTLKHHFFQVRDQYILKSKRKKLGKGGRRPWISKELIDKLKGKKVHEMLKKGPV